MLFVKLRLSEISLTESYARIDSLASGNAIMRFVAKGPQFGGLSMKRSRFRVRRVSLAEVRMVIGFSVKWADS